MIREDERSISGPGRMGLIGWVGLSGLLLAGCATGGTGPQEKTLAAPWKSTPAAAAANDEGIKLFKASQWEPAKAKFEAAIKAQPTLAEAHYNLGLVYQELRDGRAARKHFIEAANLAPGNKAIWDSPALREYGDSDDAPKVPFFLNPIPTH